jgi:UDP-2,3-diacylglucosamine pyrophosphatase LpxH
MAGTTNNYLIFSDVHLGADLVQHVRPWTVDRLKKVARIDRHLAGMLDFYRENADRDHPWRLVIAGDLVDFVGMSIAPRNDAALDSALTDEERQFGLGSAGDHAVQKMRAVAARHALVFERLAAFIAAGHSLVLVRGNHDLDFHWETARKAFVDAVVEHAPSTNSEDRLAFESRIEFFPWFYYVEGLLYVEHGHQWDAACNYSNLLAPLSPGDPTRLDWSMSDLLLRTVARPTPGLGSEGHDRTTIGHYLKLAWSIGIRGSWRLFSRYARATVRALGMWRSQMRDHAGTIRQDHERRMGELAQGMRVGLEKLRALSALWPRPVTLGALSVLRMVFLDVILSAAGLATFCALAFFFLSAKSGALAAATLFLAFACFCAWSRQRRLRDVDPEEAMRQGAGHIASLLPSRYVVMGHTHRPRVVSLGGSTYVNLGNWGVDDLESESADAPKTHLVLRFVDGEHRAEYCRWESDGGRIVRHSEFPPYPGSSSG